MTFKYQLIKYISTIRFLRILIAAVAVSGASVGYLGATDAWGAKICNVKIKYCVEQKCKITFDRVKSGVLAAYAFFNKLGYSGKYHVDIQIVPEVSIFSGQGDKRTKIRILGKYAEDEKIIYLTCWGEKWLSGRNDFHLDMTADFYETIVTHEMIHFLANRFAKQKLDVLSSEYIAYSGQLELFPEKTMELLTVQIKNKPIDIADMNDMTFVLEPGLFGLKSYLHYRQTNGALVKEIMAGASIVPLNLWPLF
jgi:hypothetical protein